MGSFTIDMCITKQTIYINDGVEEKNGNLFVWFWGGRACLTHMFRALRIANNKFVALSHPHPFLLNVYPQTDERCGSSFLDPKNFPVHGTTRYGGTLVVSGCKVSKNLSKQKSKIKLLNNTERPR